MALCINVTEMNLAARITDCFLLSSYRRCAWTDPYLPGHQCPDNFTRTNYEAIPNCVMKTCQDVCYDVREMRSLLFAIIFGTQVVRKCPVNLGFQCPPVNDIREYDTSNC
eukprot:762997-Hanusia_phi.AAC.3